MFDSFPGTILSKEEGNGEILTWWSCLVETVTRSPDTAALVLAHLAPQPSINQREYNMPNVA